MLIRRSSYLAPQLEGREIPGKAGHGVFSTAFIPQGSLLAMWGGDVLSGAELALLPPIEQHYGVQIHEDLFLVPQAEQLSAADWINHSCAPNAGIQGQCAVVALRDIEAGEEICFDYAMTDSHPYDEFICECGAPSCRGQVTAQDWQLPALQARYAGYFSWYLAQRIAGQRGG